MRLICVRPSARAEKRQKYKKDIKKRAVRLFFCIGYFQYSVFCEVSVLSISRHTRSFAAHTAPTAGLCRHSCRESAERSRLFARASATRGNMRASWGKFAGACRCGRVQVRVIKKRGQIFLPSPFDDEIFVTNSAQALFFAQGKGAGDDLVHVVILIFAQSAAEDDVRPLRL